MTSGGRCGTRLIEEIVAWAPGHTLFSKHPIEAAEAQRRLPPLSQHAIALSGIQSSDRSVLGYYSDFQYHIVVNYNGKSLIADSTEYDFHLRRVGFEGVVSAEFECTLTGGVLTASVLEKVLSSDDVNHIYNGQSGQLKLREAACDVLRGTARPIREDNAAAARNFDTRKLLPLLGFVYNKDLRVFEPPEILNSELEAKLLNIILELTPSNHDDVCSLSNALADILDLKQVPWCLSGPDFGTLGASQLQNDAELIGRYTRQVQFDPTHTAWYLEALRQIAQQRNSEDLQTHVLEARSLGIPLLGDIKDALNTLGVDLNSSDEVILNHFVQLGGDASQLAMIAEFKNSHALQEAAAVADCGYDSCYEVLGFEVGYGTDAQIIAQAKNLYSSSTIGRLKALHALQVIGLTRRSSPILSVLEKLSPRLRQPMTLENAYGLLGTTPDMDDSDIYAIFELAVDDSPNRVMDLRSALWTIADARDSQTLRCLLQGEERSQQDLIDLTGDSSPNEESLGYQGIRRMPVGLSNVGNTCYLNSVLQLYNGIPEIKRYVEEFPSPQEDDSSMKRKRVGGRLVPYLEVKRSKIFVRTLGSLFTEMDESMSSVVLPTLSLAYMAFFPPQIDTEADVEFLNAQTSSYVDQCAPESNSAPSVETEERIGNDTEKVTVTAVQSVKEVNEETQDASSNDVIDVTTPDFESTETSSGGLNVRLAEAVAPQQDVTECIENVLFQLEASCCASGYTPEDGEQLDLIKDIFYGTYVQSLERNDRDEKDPERRSTQVVRQWSLPAHLHPNSSSRSTSIYDALDSYFLPEMLGETTVRRMSLRDPPRMLQLQIQRVQFDSATGSVYKLLDPLVFDEDGIYLDRYLENPSQELQAKLEEAAQLRKEVASIEAFPQEKEDEEMSALIGTENWAAIYAHPGELSDSTLELVRRRRLQLTSARECRKQRHADLINRLEHQFDSFKSVGYRPYALFIHNGLTTTSGHYWLYMKNSNGKWYKYNDELVTEVSAQTALNQSERTTATPYFVVFERIAGSASAFIEEDFKGTDVVEAETE